jgi:hypothetical protein
MPQKIHYIWITRAAYTKNNKLGPKNEHKNTLYYEKYQTTD